MLAIAAATCASCSDPELRGTAMFDRIFQSSTPRGIARLAPKSGSTARGLIQFYPGDGYVGVAGNIFDLAPGAHSVYIHANGNCSSPNGASAGPVWNIEGAANPGRARTGDLPEINVRETGDAELALRLRGVSVGTGRPDDVIGHAVVVHDGVVRDPMPVFGADTGFIACGVIEGR